MVWYGNARKDGLRGRDHANMLKAGVAVLILLSCIFLLLSVLIIPASAHSGGTDSSGGHYVSSTGEYHYHHGHPAHQHKDGMCPYRTDSSSKTTGNTGFTFVIVMVLIVAVTLFLFYLRNKKKH